MSREETLKRLNEVAEPLTPEMMERWEKRVKGYSSKSELKNKTENK